MRIIMVCADDWIDRRILQEAVSLTEGGHQVKVLAAWVEGEPQHSTYGQVEIERIRPPRLSRPQQWLQHLSQWLRKPLPGGSKSLVTLAERSLMHLLRGWKELTPIEEVILDRIRSYQPDCVHVHDLPQLRVGVAAKRELGIRLVYDAHELFPELCHLSWIYKKLWRARERKYAPFADQVITVNEFLAEEMKKEYGIPLPAVILNAIDPPSSFSVDEPNDRLREELSIPPDHAILLYQGYLYPSRALEPMVEAMIHVRSPVHLVIMGMGPLRPTLEAIAQSLPGPLRVSCIGPIPQDEVLWWSASADAGIIPYQAKDKNKELCSPNKLFELIQAGLPILSNDLPYLRKVIAGGGMGQVEKLTDPKSYARAIDRFFADPQKLEQYRYNTLEARKRYNWSNEGRHLRELYQQLAPLSTTRAA